MANLTELRKHLFAQLAEIKELIWNNICLIPAMKQLMDRLNKLNDGSWQNIALLYTIKIIAAAIILFIGFWIINRINKIINGFFEKRSIDNTVKSFLKTLISAGLKIVLVIFLLNFIGIQTTSIVALIGAAGLAIGLALQGTLTNLAGGVMILLFKPFRVGDIIEAQGKKGKVTDIQIFNTILSVDDKTIIIPNSILSNGIIENSGKNAPLPTGKISTEQKK
ncbi:MAG: mechanosensitive ion channel [Ferruginibacter sp.]